MEKRWKKAWKSNNEGCLMSEKSVESRDAMTKDEGRLSSSEGKHKEVQKQILGNGMDEKRRKKMEGTHIY